MYIIEKKRLFIFLFIFLISSVLLAVFIYAKSPILLPLQRSELTIRWTTQNELDIVGFNLHRADSPGGDYVKINDSLIRAADDPVTGNEHVYVDKNVIPGQTYYYRLEIIYRHGNASFEGPYAITATAD